MSADFVRWLCRVCGVVAAVVGGSVHAGVVTDGTVGPRVQRGGDFEIGADLGRQAGRNLFHSFERFSLATGERATFSGPDQIRNIISRVTGGARSDIDGTIHSTIPGADFYLINPAGIAFGPNALLNVPGSFHVATADELRFADGARFSARDPAASSFTVAAPEAFGFLQRGNGGINIVGSTLEALSRETISLVGGDLRIRSGRITIPQGRLNLVAKKSAGEVGLESAEIRRTGRGAVVITDQSQIDLGGFGSGIVHVRAGTFVVAGSDVAANNSSSRTATGRIDIDADEVIVGTGGRLRTDVFGSGSGGRVKIVADRVDVSGGVISASTFDQGAAGRVDVTAGELHVRERGVITSSVTEADALGAAGQVNIIAVRLEVSGISFIQASSLDGAPGRAGHVTVVANEVIVSGRSANLRSGLFASGADNGGTIVVEAGTLRISDGSLISVRGGQGDARLMVGTLRLAGGGQVDALTTSARNAGDIIIQADTISIVGADSGLLADSEGEGAGAGDAGLVEIETGDLVVRDLGRISAGSSGGGAGGGVAINAHGDVLISGGSVGTGALSGADEDFGAGAVTLVADRVLIENGGEIAARGTQGAVTVRASEVTLTDGGRIEIDVSGVGQGGNITVDAHSVAISGRDIERNLFSGLLARSDGRSRSGDIELRASRVTIDDGGEISTIAFGDGRGGDIRVDAGNSIAIAGMSADGLPSGVFSSSDRGGDAGDIALRAAGSLALNGGEIRSSSAASGGGEITLRVGELIDLRQGAIESSVFGGTDPAAGNITIDPRFLVIDRSIIKADARTGNGGDIEITAENILVSGGDLEALLARGDISASGETEEVAGTIGISAPEVELSGGLVILDTVMLEAASQLPERCAARRDIGASSFTGVGRGGLPPSPDGPLAGAYLSGFGAAGFALLLEEGDEEISHEAHSVEPAIWPAVAGLAPCRGAL